MSDTPQNDEVTNEVVSAAVETNDSIPSSESGGQVQAESNEQVDEVALAKQKAKQLECTNVSSFSISLLSFIIFKDN